MTSVCPETTSVNNWQWFRFVQFVKWWWGGAAYHYLVLGKPTRIRHRIIWKQQWWWTTLQHSQDSFGLFNRRRQRLLNTADYVMLYEELINSYWRT